MKIGIDAPWYKDSVERVAFNAYAVYNSNIENVIDYINRYDEDDLEAACYAVDCPYEDAIENIDYIAEKTGREINAVD